MQPSAFHLPEAAYETDLGGAYVGDALDLTRRLPPESVNLIVTSPPFALNKKKAYGNVAPDEYVRWFLPFASEFHRVLTPDGSLVIHIGGSWEKGTPTRSLYHFQLLIALCNGTPDSFHLAQDFYWFNPARIPSPAQWVTVNRVRVKDAVDPIWWLSKEPNPKADNRRVKTPYTKAMQTLLTRGYNSGPRPSGHNVSERFGTDHGGAIPPNLLVISNTDSNSYYLRACRSNDIPVHPARYPVELPEFFINFLTDPDDLVLDPFAGSNTTGRASENLGRKWLAFEQSEVYVKGSAYRFWGPTD